MRKATKYEYFRTRKPVGSCPCALPKTSTIGKGRLLSSTSVVARALIMLLVLALFLFLLSLIPPNILQAIAAVAGAIASCVMAYFFAVLGIEYGKDRRELRNCTRGRFTPDRVAIARNFSAMRTSWGRMQYVRWLEDSSMDCLEALRRDTNIWPNGRRPQYDGDAGSVRLAQLDARWLDLD
jgi:hypothetical protein